MSTLQQDTFEIIEQLRECPHKMFEALHKHMEKHCDIDLYIIAYINGKFSMVPNQSHKHLPKACLLFNTDNSVCGPLYTINVRGDRKIVFSHDTYDSYFNRYMYTAQLNYTGKFFIHIVN